MTIVQSRRADSNGGNGAKNGLRIGSEWAKQEKSQRTINSKWAQHDKCHLYYLTLTSDEWDAVFDERGVHQAMCQCGAL